MRLKVWGLLWAAILAVELLDLPNQSLLTWVIPPFELILWSAAVLISCHLVYSWSAAQTWRHVLRLGAALVLLAPLVWFNNWSAFHPQSYYELHRPGFDAVAALVDSGEVGTSQRYYGEKLPRHLADLSTDGRASVVGHTPRGTPVVFLPQYLGIPDDAIGFAYIGDDVPDGTGADLYGDLADFAIDLGDGWWWVN